MAAYCVYFVKSGRFVKVGRSSDVDSRLNSIKTSAAYGVKLLLTIPCRDFQESVSLEKIVHNLFSVYRTTGEWFKYSKGMRAFIRAAGKGEQGKKEAIKILSQRASVSPRRLSQSLA